MDIGKLNRRVDHYQHCLMHGFGSLFEFRELVSQCFFYQLFRRRFLYDENVFRFIYRVDGKPIWNKPLAPYKSGNVHRLIAELERIKERFNFLIDVPNRICSRLRPEEMGRRADVLGGGSG